MNCLVCRSEEKRIFESVESFGYPLIYYQCQNCGLIYQDSDESMVSDPAFYQDTYRKIYQADVNPTVKDIWVQQKRAGFLNMILRKNNLMRPQNVLDIGASTGLLLNEFKEVLGSDVMGVEPGEAYRHYAEGQGLRMFSSIDNLTAEVDKKFDLVSMIHVLEHLPDPISYLVDIREKLLAESGHILIEVPNFYGHDSYELAHLTCFTPHTLQDTLKRAGYHIVSVVRHGFPRSSLFRLYITILAVPLTDKKEISEKSPERFVRIKRQFSMIYRRLLQKIFPKKAWLPLPTESGS